MRAPQGRRIHGAADAAGVFLPGVTPAGAGGEDGSEAVLAEQVQGRRSQEASEVRAGAAADVADAWGDTPRSIAQKKGMESVLALM